MTDYSYIGRNYRALLDEIEVLSKARGEAVRLVAVTKSGTDEELIALAEAGATDIGENRPQQLQHRGALLAERGFHPALHEIGNLQRNKVKLIIENVSLIHSLDSLSLAEEINKQAGRAGRKVPVLIEINSAREEAKGGIMPEDAESFMLALSKFESIEVAGLMTMGSVCDEPEQMRPYFRLTKEIFDKLRATYGFAGGGILSMGMSDSYAVAIEEGATLVRVGRKIFLKN